MSLSVSTPTPLDRIGVSPSHALAPLAATATPRVQTVMQPCGGLGSQAEAGSPAVEDASPVQVDDRAASRRATREASPSSDLDDSAAQEIARSLQRALAQTPASVSMSSHTALLHRLA